MIVDQGRDVPLDVIAELCGLWSPGRRTTRRPGHGGSLCSPATGALVWADTMADEMERTDFGDDIKRAKTRTKYLRTPVTLVVGCAPHDNEMLHDENRDAVAAGIQNLLLGATALGLASFWSTPALTQPSSVLDLCGFESDDRLVGMIYLGWAAQPCPTPERPQLPITHVEA